MGKNPLHEQIMVNRRWAILEEDIFNQLEEFPPDDVPDDPDAIWKSIFNGQWHVCWFALDENGALNVVRREALV